MWKVYRIKGFPPLTPPPLEEYVLYTRLNVDNYGYPLSHVQLKSIQTEMYIKSISSKGE